MSTPAKIELPDDLRKLIRDDLDRLDRERSGGEQALSGIQAEINSHEKTQVELTQRIASLSARVVEDESAAQELSNVERRAAAIRTRLEQLRAKPLPRIDLEGTYSALYNIIFLYQEGVKARFLRDLAVWQIEEHQARMVIGQVPALLALLDLSAWLSRAPGPTAANLQRICTIFKRALRGEIDLRRDTISDVDQSSSPPQTAQTV